jgi:alpha-tubulin suppressor-like RCC1 family protein
MDLSTEVFAWGLDNKGQLGLGSQTSGKSISTPRFCSFNIVIKQVSCGEDHSGFISESGHLYMMGSNQHGKLGLGDRSLTYSASPHLVEALEAEPCCLLSCGGNHSAVITSSNELFTWGLGQFGALGTGSLETIYLPVKIHDNVSDVSCGTRHTAVISNLNLLTCGAGDAGQLGTGRRTTESKLVIINSPKVLQVSCGEFHTGLLSPEGKVYMMGGNSFGQLGTGNKKSCSIPTKIDLPRALKVSCGSHSACLTVDGLFVWGSSVFGEFLSPTRVKLGKIRDVSVGGAVSLALDSEFKLFAWGNNSNGELGQGDFNSRSTAVQVSCLKNKKLGKIAAGGNFAICLGQNLESDLGIIENFSSISEICCEKQESSRNYQKQFPEDRVKIAKIEKIAKITTEFEDLQEKHLKSQENFQNKLQEVNFSLQNVSKEASQLREELNNVNSQLHLVKNENGFLKEENLKLKKAAEAAASATNESLLAKITEKHFFEIQEIQALVEKEKILKKQVERDLEVALNHRQRLETALAKTKEQLEASLKTQSVQTEASLQELLQTRSLNESLSSKVRALEGTVQDMYEEITFYSENMKELHKQQEKMQNLMQETQTSNISIQAESRHQKATIDLLSQENSELKIMLADLEKTVQDLLSEKEKLFSQKISDFKEKSSQVLTPKVPNLKNLMPQIELLSDAPLTSNRKNLADIQKERLRKAASKLIENQNPQSPLNSLRFSPQKASPDHRSDSFTFRKSSTPSKDEVKEKIKFLMQNRSRIEKRLQILQSEQETL